MRLFNTKQIVDTVIILLQIVKVLFLNTSMTTAIKALLFVHSLYFRPYSQKRSGPGSSVCITTDYELDGPGIESWVRSRPKPSDFS
jgi:hypothetical protein